MTVAVASALPVALASPSLAACIDPVHDPIFAAIEEHRSAFIEHMQIITNVPTTDDDLICEGPAYDASYDRTEAAAIALTDIRPTTVEGVVALLAYINHFNRGGLQSMRRKSVHSEHMFWPKVLVEDVDVAGSHKMPFPYWVLENVRAALSRPSLVNVVIGAPIASAPTVSSAPTNDRIFDLIDRHREECEGINTAAAVYDASDDHLAAACDEERDMYESLRQSGTPTTLAGWAALLRYVTEYESDLGEVTDQLQEFCARLAASLERMVAQS